MPLVQERTEGHNLQGRDSTAHYFYRTSMSDPEYSVGERRQRDPPRGLVTPTVHVAEGTNSKGRSGALSRQYQSQAGQWLQARCQQAAL